MITIIKGNKFKEFKELTSDIFTYGREVFKDTYLIIDDGVLRVINFKGKVTFLPELRENKLRELKGGIK